MSTTSGILHLVSSPVSSGTLKYAIRQNLLTGDVFCTMDYPEIGPLQDGIVRKEYWKSLDDRVIKKRGETEQPMSDSFEPWRQLRSKLTSNSNQQIFLWIGGTAGDYVFLRMTFWWLKHLNNSFFLINVPPLNGQFAVAAYPPSALVRLIATANLLSEFEKAHFAQEYEGIMQRPELLREIDEEGILQFRSISEHDTFLTLCCTTYWQKASAVIGKAMSMCHPRNQLGDSFFASRLKYLIGQGVIMANGAPLCIQSFNIKLAN